MELDFWNGAECDHEKEQDSWDEEEPTFVTWFCRKEGQEFYCKVDEHWQQPQHVRLKKSVPYYDLAIQELLGYDWRQWWCHSGRRTIL
jgi:casein kinase II subunit beta